MKIGRSLGRESRLREEGILPPACVVIYVVITSLWSVQSAGRPVEYMREHWRLLLQPETMLLLLEASMADAPSDPRARIHVRVCAGRHEL